MTECFVYDAVRTPRGRGRSDGALHQIPPVHLASHVLASLRNRNALDTSIVDDVVLGCVAPVGDQGSNVGRISALNAGFSDTVSGVQINRYCGSGLEAINMAAGQITSGQSDVSIGGGVESMSRVPMGADAGAWFSDPEIAFKTYYVPQGIGADLLATKWGFSRDDVDAYAVESQRRAAHAWEEKRFSKSIVPIHDSLGQVLLERDEHMRPETTIQTLAALKPAFADIGSSMGYDAVALQRYPEVERINHVHHAGNSSGIVDGSAAVLLGTREAGARMGLEPRARIRAFSSVGTEPCIMLTGPQHVTKKVLARAGMSIKDVDLFEINEAFASVILVYRELFDINPTKLNVNGGAIALGHPLGATGAMLLGTALDELERADLNVALISLCVGAGMGTATIIERV